MSKTPPYESVLAEMKRRFLVHSEDQFDWEIDPMESPIEKVFVATMIADIWEPALRLGSDEYRALLGTLADAGLYWDSGIRWEDNPQRMYGLLGGAAACTQCWLDLKGRRVRPDFAFVLPGEHGCKIIVELDGHDFHERTPEQAQSDKSRDRELQALGWHVMRFTGREVLRNPDGCLSEVRDLLFAKLALHRARERAKDAEP